MASGWKATIGVVTLKAKLLSIELKDLLWLLKLTPTPSVSSQVSSTRTARRFTRETYYLFKELTFSLAVYL